MSDASEDILHDDLLFQPSPIHQTLKAQFWARYVPNPLLDKEDIGLTTVQELVPDPRLKRYWAKKGFKAWFLNQDENRERVSYLWQVGLDTAEQLLRDSTVQASAKVNLIKLIAEVSGHLKKGSSDEAKFSDDAVNKMGESELKAFLAKKGIKAASGKRSIAALVPPSADEEEFN